MKISFAMLTTIAMLASVSACGGGGAANPVINPLPDKLVIGHRGASALRPEHTIESYTKAIEDGGIVRRFKPDGCPGIAGDVKSLKGCRQDV